MLQANLSDYWFRLRVINMPAVPGMKIVNPMHDSQGNMSNKYF